MDFNNVELMSGQFKGIKQYKVGQKLHVVDFKKDKSNIGTVNNITPSSMSLRLDDGNRLTMQFKDINANGYGTNIIIR